MVYRFWPVERYANWRPFAHHWPELTLRVEGTIMTDHEFIALIVCLVACVCAAGFSLSFTASAGRNKRDPLRTWPGPGKNLVGIALGPQWDLFGTPFGPPFRGANTSKTSKLIQKLTFTENSINVVTSEEIEGLDGPPNAKKFS